MEEEGLRRPATPFSREHLQSRRGPQGGCVQTPASGVSSAAVLKCALALGDRLHQPAWEMVRCCYLHVNCVPAIGH